ncbi:flagellar biosynthesis anti-sigma factor FlgM [Natranaerobius trueperi]|nr:flagellar biosynthesis anti-sigma factor FlgM [Natranaerobius trueperi]
MNRISGNYNQFLKAYQKNISKVEKTSKVENNEKSNSSSKKRDALELTGVSREIKSARNEISKLDEKQSDRINELKQSISEGNYDVSGKEIADKMLQQGSFDREV